MEHACPICDETRRQPLYRTRDRHYNIPGEWTVAKCVGCGLVQIHPMLTTEKLMSMYPTDFYAYTDQRRVDLRENGFIHKVKRALFSSLHVQDPVWTSPGRILDSGCGTGWSLLKFRSLGWECIGVEPSDAAAYRGRQLYNLDIRGGTIHTERFPEEHFKYIRSNHSLEHDPDCGATIREFHRVLRKDGRLLIGVPNIDSLPAKCFGRYWYYLGVPVHTYSFSLKHLSGLLSRYGFEIESIRYTGNYHGIIGSLQIYVNRNKPRATSQDGWLINSRSCWVIGQIVAIILNRMRCGDAVEVIAKRVA